MTAGSEPTESKFISSFQRALAFEIEAVRAKESVTISCRYSGDLDDDGDFVFSFVYERTRLPVTLPVEAILYIKQKQYAVAVTDISGSKLSLKPKQPLEEDAINDESCVLEIDPATPLVKLQLALTEALEDKSYQHQRALALFTNSPDAIDIEVQEEPGLNEWQQNALHTALKYSHSFIWGPPGTGKSKTLAAIANELVSRSERVIIATTTNAAVDAILAHCLEHSLLKQESENGSLLRIGSGAGDFEFLSLIRVIEKVRERQGVSLQKYRVIRKEWKKRVAALNELIDITENQLENRQIAMFQKQEAAEYPAKLLEMVFRCPYSPETKEPECLLRFFNLRLKRLTSLEQKVSSFIQNKREEYSELRKNIISGAKLIVTTLSSLCYYDELRSFKPDTVILDEAGMVTPPFAYLAGALAVKRIVIAGDPRQLPPVVKSQHPYAQKVLARDIFHIAPGVLTGVANCTPLLIQYRMPPAIGALVSKLFYEGKLQTLNQSIDSSNIFLIDTSGTGAAEQTQEKSRINTSSIEVTLSLIENLRQEGISSGAVIAPYNAQSKLYRKAMQRLGYEEQWECATVHRFQGREKPVVILDLVDSYPLLPGALLKDSSLDSTAARLLNVSISRASRRLYILADCKFFRDRAPTSVVCRLLSAVRETATTVSAVAI